MLKNLLLACGMVCGLAGVPAAAADGWPARLVCHDDVFVPYFMQNGGAVSGINVDILTEAAHRVGIAIEFRVTPWRRLESELARKSDAIDCAFALSRTPQREAYLEFGKVPMQPTEYALFVRADSGISQLDDLAGKTIGARAGFRLPDEIKAGAEAKRWRVEEVSSDSADFQKLALKRVDAVLADSFVGRYTMHQLGASGIKRLEPPLSRFDTYLVFRKSAYSAALAAAFDRAFLQMRQDGTMDRLNSSYWGPAAR